MPTADVFQVHSHAKDHHSKAQKLGQSNETKQNSSKQLLLAMNKNSIEMFIKTAFTAIN